MKLIILNGPAGVGKSTLSRLLYNAMPETSIIDIDELRRSIPNYKEKRQESLLISYEKAVEVIEELLQQGQNVIIDKAISHSDILEKFVEIGKKYHADTYEFLLFADKRTIQARADERGYIPGSLLTPEKVGELWEKINALREQRPSMIFIDTKNKTIDQTLAYVKEIIQV